VYFPTLMLKPLFEDLDRRARCVAPRSLLPARARGRRIRPWGTQAPAARLGRSAVSARAAGAGPAGARS
jgi:hypothetical protein